MATKVSFVDDLSLTGLNADPESHPYTQVQKKLYLRC